MQLEYAIGIKDPKVRLGFIAVQTALVQHHLNLLAEQQQQELKQKKFSRESKKGG